MEEARTPRDGGDDADIADRETAPLLSTAAAALATAVVEAGMHIPVVSHLFEMLDQVKREVDKAVRRVDELNELHAHCCIITAQVIDKYRVNSFEFDISPLQKCIEDLNEVAGYCGHDRGALSYLRFRKHGDRVQKLRDRIDRLVPILGLAAGVSMSSQLEVGLQTINDLLTEPTRRPAPKGLPVCQSWLTMRNGVIDRLLEGFNSGGKSRVLALVGRSGSGKTLAAASFVDVWRGQHRSQQTQVDNQARVRLCRVQALFPDGVLWLRVGEGGGSADRLPTLMRTLAQKLYEEILQNSVDAQMMVWEDSIGYIKKVVAEGRGGKKGLCCLVVADDVWEATVIEGLRKTGMWVLLTTRHDSMVFDEKVVVDRMSLTEAESLLRGAACLHPGERLPDAAQTILERCDHVAMDVAFVGRWGMVRTGRDGDVKGEQAWTQALREIDAQVDAVRHEEGAMGMDGRGVNRLAILRAGANYLAQEDGNAEALYAALVVLPDSYGFSGLDAAVLLYDAGVHAKRRRKTVECTLAVLEQWEVLRRDTSGLYRMHNVHMHSARALCVRWTGIRLEAIRRWTSHISDLQVACDMDVFTLAALWRALQRAGGEGWQISRPYDSQLLSMTHADPSKLFAVHLVGDLYRLDNYSGVEIPMQRLIDDCVENPDSDPLVTMAAVWYLGRGLRSQGRTEEYKEITRRLSVMINSGHKPSIPVDGCSVQLATVIYKHGLLMYTAGRSDDAENWLRGTLKAQQDGGLETSSQATRTLDLLGWCVLKMGRPVEAEGFFRQALRIREANMEPGNLAIATTLFDLGRCVDRAGRPDEAEGLFRRAMEIRLLKMKPDDLSIAETLYRLGRCIHEAGRPGEAASFYVRAIEIREANVPPHDLPLADMLHGLGRCIHWAGRPGEADKHFRRELSIRVVSMEPEALAIASTLSAVARCLRDVKQLEEAEGLFKEALRIREAGMEPDALGIANTVFDVALCAHKAGRPREAELGFKRALDIREARLDHDEACIVDTLYRLGRCVYETGRPREAEEFYRQAHDVLQVKQDVDDLLVANVLYGLGRCVCDTGRPREAEGYFTRTLAIRDAIMDPDDLAIAATLYVLGRCVQTTGRTRQAELLFKRALNIREAKLEPHSLPVAETLYQLGLCVYATGRPGQAEGFLKRSLEIREAEILPDNLCLANVLSRLGRCVHQAGRPEEAVVLFKRELVIRELKLESDGLTIANTMNRVARCYREMGRLGQAEDLFSQALDIQEANIEPNDLSIALMLSELGLCVHDAGRPREAERMFKRALRIKKTQMGPDDVFVAEMLYRLGKCVYEGKRLGQLGEAEGLFKRALDVCQAGQFLDGLLMANTLVWIGRCMYEAGKPGEAEGYLKRALATRTIDKEADDVSVAATLHMVGRCVHEAGRLAEAESFFRRSLEKREEPDDLAVASTLNSLARCVRTAGRLHEAEVLFKRALTIRLAKMDPDALPLATTLCRLGRCLLEAGRLGEAEQFMRRALKIKEAKMEADNLSVANTLCGLGQCIYEAGRPEEAEVYYMRASKIRESNK